MGYSSLVGSCIRPTTLPQYLSASAAQQSLGVIIELVITQTRNASEVYVSQAMQLLRYEVQVGVLDPCHSNGFESLDELKNQNSNSKEI
mmetsp:Transcript_1314/g.2747  ORF Transcript_1314/g.2747 Transcript_1314/m.2747 type:complete len:89 (-) Transcript_1314:1399-1665(-)|eukprot:CAMPEP_0184688604 /NCGR_PEP_ID=MMETSP0312-20130426/30189_1 /TAXON_ID=31354 /ORGANISM="Compsopogon coeruleus, Strain SAG 36.94" /LENGTH=88 /DNA_ID=CAMNT_0027145857 /DNA_START=194 /DNA_END=460 /DNA_ORIENTATION=+